MLRLEKYRDPDGNTLIWPTFVHFLGDICGLIGLLTIIGGPLYLTDGNHTVLAAITTIVWMIVPLALMTVLHNTAQKSAARKILVRQERHTTSKKLH